MQIAYVLTSLGVGGAERQALALAARMRARGHAVSLLVLRGRQPQEWSTTLDLFCLEIRRTRVSIRAGLWKARRYLRDFQPDLIHSHTYPANMAARLLRISLPETAVLSTIHNVYEGRWPRMLAYRLTDGLSRHTTAVSYAAAARFVRLKAVPAHKSSVLANGIDTTEFAPSPERRARTRTGMGVSGEFVWLAAGRLTPAKDYPNLLSAFAHVRAAVPSACLWVAGEFVGTGFATIQSLADDLGSSVRWLGLRRDMPALLDAADGFVLANGIDTTEFAPSPERRARTRTGMGVSGEVVWRGAGRITPAKDYPNLLSAFAHVRAAVPSACLWVAGEFVGTGFATIQSLADDLGSYVRWLGLRRDMPSVLDAADGFVLASAWEGMPLAIEEAMAMEKPVVATDAGVVRELVGETGFIVSANSPENLAEAMLEMMRRTDEERHRMGRSARERIAAHFSMDVKADEWELLYREVLAHKK